MKIKMILQDYDYYFFSFWLSWDPQFMPRLKLPYSEKKKKNDQSVA